MNIFKYEFNTYSKSILIWGLSIAMITIFFFAIFPTFAKDATMAETMLEHYPKEMLAAFGMNTALPLSSVAGYLVFTFAFLQLFLAIQAANYGFSILSIEERELTADFLMSKPVSRRRIIVSKFLAAFLALTLVNGITWISVYGSIEIFRAGKAYDGGQIAILLSSIVLFQLFFMCFGMVVSVMVSKIRSVLSYSMALAFGMYVLNAVRAIVDGNLLGFFTPFYHFDPGYILENRGYNVSFVMISVVMIVISMVLSYYLYLRRNIHSL